MKALLLVPFLLGNSAPAGGLIELFIIGLVAVGILVGIAWLVLKIFK